MWSTPYNSGPPIPRYPCNDSVPDDVCQLGAIQSDVKFGDGSGTTPTLVGKNYEYLAFADGSRPMKIVVLRTSDGSEVPVDNPVPISDPDAQTENTITACDYRFAIESNSTKGIAAYEISRENGNEIVKLKWVRDDIYAPNAVPLASCGSNLFYFYELQQENDDPWDSSARWFVTAVDIDTGEIIWRQHIGDGLDYNSLYAPLNIDDRGRMYIGLFGGFMRLK